MIVISVVTRKSGKAVIFVGRVTNYKEKERRKLFKRKERTQEINK